MEGMGSDGSGELQCVGKLEIVPPKPVGFLCGTLPVPTDNAFHHAFNSEIVPSSETVSAPRYRMLPTETDLNTPPLLSHFPDKVLPVDAVRFKTGGGDLHWDTGPVSQNLARKCEALAVSGLAEYGDEIDVVAPADIVKQIFKMPYSKAQLSIAVHRIGQTLVLNTGPDVEEGEKLVRRHNNQAKCADQSLFLNFAMHSVRVEACDCPPSKNVPSEEQADSTILPGQYESRKGSFVSSDSPVQSDGSQYLGQSADGCQKARLRHCTKYSNVNPDDFVWASKRNKRNNRRDAVEKTSQVGEKPRCIVQESDKYRRIGNDGFLRALFWQFHNFRMLLGSDLLLFSNEKYVAVSLHLWDVARQVTPLTWLEAWLDNVMASVPELAICYHQNGVVQGYELLKTDDIFLLKGISEDGTPAFNPHVVQQNGHSVFRFLQDNCKQDPGAYWLYKSAGEDVIHLFDLSVIPENHSTDAHDNSSSGLPSLMHRRRRDSLFSLGTLLSRVAHRLSLSMTPNGRAKCARLFKKCFEFLDKQDHLVVRAFAHEQFARLILKCYEELDLTLESLPLESEVTVTDAEGESSDYSLSVAGSIGHDKLSSQGAEKIPSTNDAKIAQELVAGMASPKLNLEANVSASRKILASESTEKGKPSRDLMDSEKEDSLVICQGPTTNSHVIQTIADPISSRLAAIHHVSQAIKSLRWKRQLQSTEEEELMDHGIRTQDRSSAVHLTACACGDPDCIEVCDIREWLPKSKMDHKLWKLVLLLGESYLALGEAYKENGQLNQTLKVVELACSVYGSVPQHLEDAQFISSIIISSSSHSKFNGVSGKTKPFLDDETNSDSGCSDNSFTTEQLSSSYLFWAKAWTLVGDVYVEYHMIRGKEIYLPSDGKARNSELRMSSEVLKEVKRLKKKLGQYKQNCSTCSLINCSCQSDRASSGNSASSSSGVTRPLAYGRKQSKRSNLKNSLPSLFKYSEDDLVHPKAEIGNDFQGGCPTSDRGGESGETLIQALHAADELGGTYVASNSGQSKGTSVMPNTDSTAAAGSGPREASKEKTGGIFKFLEGPVVGDIEYNLSSAISCYDTARKAIPTSSSELQSILKKKGWACNELGRCRLESKNLDEAELAFADAINAFKEVSDHTNIILINCNLGHGRRALAEEMVFKLENLRTHALWKSACNQAVAAAKQEYSASLRYYGAARAELNAIGEGAGSVSSSLRDEVITQFAHTYLRLGMLLAREDISAEIYENGVPDDMPVVYVSPSDRRPTKELRKREISANDAIREALCMYDSLGELRKQEAAYAYFQLACYHRDCCLKFLDSNQKQINPSRSESILQKVKQYASLAERNWQKSIDFYGPKTHPTMHVTILMERSALSLSLSYYFQSNMMLESALSRLLEGHHVFGEPGPDSLSSNFSEVCAKLWSQLQLLLKRMLTVARSGSTNKSCLSQAAPTNSRSGDIGKLKELYRMSLKSTEMNQLCAMYELWMS